MKTILFAAGASVPFFNPRLNTKYITQAVTNPDNWGKVFNKLKSIKVDGECIADVGLMIEIIKTIQNISPDYNFEQIAEVIDKISSLSFDHSPLSNMVNLLENTLFQITCAKPNRGIDYLQYYPFLLREIVADCILKLEREHRVPNYEELIIKQHNFIERISNLDGEISLMSINYDDCVLDSIEGLGISTGFEYTDSTYLNQLNISHFFEAPKVVYFPHGHLRFKYSDNDNVTYVPDAEEAEKARWEGMDSSRLGSTLTITPGKFAYNFNTFITTGQTKDDSLNYLPYSAYYHRLSVDIFKSNLLIVIGYSFGDDHFNRLMRSFLEFSRNNKLLIVDFYENDVTMTNEYKNSNNLIYKIYSVFNPSWNFILNDKGKIDFSNPESVEHVNNYGFGYIFDRILFYKNGYDSFLHEYENVIKYMECK